MTVTALRPATAPPLNTTDPAVATCISMVSWPDTDVVLRAECGLFLALAGGELVHTDRCRDCYDPITGEPTVAPGEKCPAFERHTGECDDPQAAECDHPHCHAGARVDVPPCTRGHLNCCGCCREEE